MEARPPLVNDLYQEEIYHIKDRVLIVLSTPWESLSQDDKTLLSKILGAIKLSLDGVQIITQRKPDFQSIKNLAPKWVIQFSNEGTEDNPYYINTSTEGLSLVKSHALSDLDDVRKKSLWLALKSLIQG